MQKGAVLQSHEEGGMLGAFVNSSAEFRRRPSSDENGKDIVRDRELTRFPWLLAPAPWLIYRRMAATGFRVLAQ